MKVAAKCKLLLLIKSNKFIVPSISGSLDLFLREGNGEHRCDRAACGSNVGHDPGTRAKTRSATNLVIFYGLYKQVNQPPDGYALTVSSVLGACSRRNEKRRRQLASFKPMVWLFPRGRVERGKGGRTKTRRRANSRRASVLLIIFHRGRVEDGAERLMIAVGPVRATRVTFCSPDLTRLLTSNRINSDG